MCIGMKYPPLSRRTLLRWMVGAAATTGALPLTAPGIRRSAFAAAQEAARQPSSSHGQLLAPLSESDDTFLNELEQATFLYFVEQVNPETGIVRDRCNIRTPDTSDLGSIAAT